MKSFKDVFAEADKDDPRQLLELFLFYRDHRSNFDQIEIKEAVSEAAGTHQILVKPVKLEIQQSLVVRIKGWCYSILP